MLTKGPLAMVTINVVTVTLLICASVYLFAVESIRRDGIKVDNMMSDIPAIIEIHDMIDDYPNLSKINYTQDGNLTLLDYEENEITQLTVNTEAQIEALCNMERIYRDDTGINFSYVSNHFSTMSKVVFTDKSMEELKNKKSENEVVTKIANGVYTIVYNFDYERFLSKDEILYQANLFVDSLLVGAEDILANE